MTAVLITTDNRGVYFGRVLDDSKCPEAIVLADARVCVTWDTGHRGFLYLAVEGPKDVADVSPAVGRLTVYGIATIAECTPAAAEAWDAS